MNTTIITLIIIYVLSAFMWWLYLKLAYTHKRGIWNTCSNVTLWEFIITFIPAFNTVMVLSEWVFYYPLEKQNGEKQNKPNYNWFIGKKDKL